jgi:hypothetical protein
VEGSDAATPRSNFDEQLIRAGIYCAVSNGNHSFPLENLFIPRPQF